MSAMTPAGTAPYYFVPAPSRHPVLAAAGLFMVIFGAGQWVNGSGWAAYVLLAGLAVWLTVLYQWFGDAIRESEGGLYSDRIDVSFRWSMSWFIFSEVMFFAAFFGALYWARVHALPMLGNLEHQLLWPDFRAIWPNAGGTASPAGTVEPFAVIGPWPLPTINTAILLTSGVTITIAHHALKAGNRGILKIFLALTFILGFGAMVLVGPDAIRAIDAGGNMAAPMLAELLGGRPFLGFIAAVAFATILAVVAGLALSGAAALSHDLWASVVRRGQPKPGEELRVARLATVLLALVAIALGITFKGQNVAFMVGLAFAIAASANFPALVLSVFWRRTTTAGAAASMVVGTVATLTLIYLSPAVQVDLLKRTAAVFPLKNPALVTIPLAFAVGIVVSLLRPDPAAAARHAALEPRLLLGEERTGPVA